MSKLCLLLAIVCLGSCATTTGGRIHQPWEATSFTGLTPAPEFADQKNEAPDKTTLPLGIGLTAGPSTALLGATLDFPFDKQLTFGPSAQFGFDDSNQLATLTGQFKYYMPIGENDAGGSSVLPYLTGGVGIASLDTQGHSRDDGLILNVGAGLRYLTGERYRVGSEVRFNFLPDKLSGESTFLSVELLQLVLEF